MIDWKLTFVMFLFWPHHLRSKCSPKWRIPRKNTINYLIYYNAANQIATFTRLKSNHVWSKPQNNTWNKRHLKILNYKLWCVHCFIIYCVLLLLFLLLPLVLARIWALHFFLTVKISERYTKVTKYILLFFLYILWP